jgi:hypothetical protein
MFTSFNLKYPEYEVITPQTHASYHTRSLNVRDEEHLKASFLTPSKITEHLNKCIYDSLVKKPDSIKSYNDFLKNVTLKDRDALLYGLYHITYEDIRNYEIKCGNCGKNYQITVKASKTFNSLPYPKKDVLKKKVEVILPISTGVSVIIKQPTMFDELLAFQTLGSQPNANNDIITETLVIHEFKQLPENGDVIVWTEPGDIIDAYLSLPSLDKRKIHSTYRETFGKYGIVLKMKSTCIHCGQEEGVDLDLVQNFFRMVYSV